MNVLVCTVRIEHVCALFIFTFPYTRNKCGFSPAEGTRISPSCENTYGDFARRRKTCVIREKLLFDFEREPGASPSWNLVYMRIPLGHFPLKICFCNVARRDSLFIFRRPLPRAFPSIFISIRPVLLIVKRDGKCEHLGRSAAGEGGLNREEWRVGKDVEWRSSGVALEILNVTLSSYGLLNRQAPVYFAPSGSSRQVRIPFYGMRK